MKVTIYTDGSCWYKTKLGGWACILICDGATKELSGPLFDTTTSRAELQAIIVALSSLKGSGHEVELFTDSEYAIKVIRGISRPKFNHDLIETIRELVSRHQVTPWHVRGHTGNPFNERCDHLAGQAYKSSGGPVTFKRKLCDKPTAERSGEGA